MNQRMLNGAAKSIERHGQMELSRQLKTRREEQGLSQDEVAKAIFVSRQTISNWETDKTYPDVQSLLLLSQLYDTSIDELVRGDAGRIQQVVERDSRKMRLLSYGMIGFSLLAFLFLLGFSLAWPEPSSFARMSKGNIAGGVTFIVLYAIGFGMAIAIDRLKKKHDIVTYREIDRFLKGGDWRRARFGRACAQASGSWRCGKAPRWRGDWAASCRIIACPRRMSLLFHV